MLIQPAQIKTLRVAEVISETADFKTFVFEEGHGISYKSGQYLTLVRQQGEGELRRSYSITSSPALGEPLSIGVKRIPNGVFSRWLLDHVHPGDELQTTGSGGLFVLPNEIDQYKQVFFFAAGSGITPVFSLMKTALHTLPHLQVVLVYSNASEKKAVYLEPIQKLQEKFAGRFLAELLFSNNPHLYKARLHRDLLLQILKEKSIAPAGQQLFYTCGPESYMRLCTYTLQGMGYPGDNIKRENFVTHTALLARPLPPDKDSHTVHIKAGTTEHEVEVHYPDNILKAAKKSGLHLPYSCELGRCGNCVARCTSGQVWHSYNEVLTEKELAQGLVLTCVGHPVGGDVTIEFG